MCFLLVLYSQTSRHWRTIILFNGDTGKEGLINRLWQLSDVQFSVIAILDQAGRVRERVEYTPYGVARNQPIADFNGNGITTVGDLNDAAPYDALITRAVDATDQPRCR